MNTNEKVIEIVSFYRGAIMDAVEFEMGQGSDEWRALRPRLLKLLGQGGLERKLRDALGIPASVQDANKDR